MRLPDEDIRAVEDEQIIMEVVTKGARGRKWKTHSKYVGDLLSAYNTAISIQDFFEVGIFRETPSGGFMYWTSLDDDLFNSPVIHDDAIRKL